MASSNAALVTAAKPKVTGAIAAAPVGTALPTDATSALNDAFKQLGYSSEDGLTNNIETDTEDTKAWGGDVVLSTRTSRKETFQTTLIQTLDTDVLKEVWGQANVKDAAGALTVKHNNTEMPPRSWVIDMLVTGNRVRRIVIPSGKITEMGEVKYADGEVTGYEITITAAPDGHGDTAIEYISKPVSA